MSVRVILSDDSAFMRSLLKKIVLEAEVEVVGEASNGKEAVELYDSLKPDLVFMDIMMPIMGGLDALKAIISKHPDAKVVMCTSVGQDKIMAEAVESGAADFIIKPFSKDDVFAALKKHAA